MKNLKFLTGLFLIITAFTFTSCEVEPIDSALKVSNNSNNNGNNNGSGNNTGGSTNPGGNTTTSDYWPSAVNNQWVFKQDGNLQDPMKMISSDNIGGNTYFTFNKMFGASDTGTTGGAVTRLRKNSGDYYIKMEDITFDTGMGFNGTQTGYEMLFLKDYLNVGQTWSGSFTQTTTIPGISSINQTVNYTGTILEKGSTITVNGHAYTDVIKMKLNENVSMEGAGMNVSTEINYWFAKNIGPVKFVSVMTDSSGTQTTTSELDSYKLN